MKTIEITLDHISKLGTKTFYNVPVLVEDDVGIESFDPSKDDHFINGAVITKLEHEVAREWLLKLRVAHRAELNTDEISGIFYILGLNKSSFAKILGLSPSKITKVFKGEQELSLGANISLINLLTNELNQPGFVKSKVEFNELPIVEPDRPAPLSNMKKLGEKA